MTNAQKWVAAFLAIFILLFLLSRLTQSNEEPTANVSSYESEDPATIGTELVTKIGCVACHGNDLKGTKLGPSLYAANQYWKRDDLINYLRNPSAFMDEDRMEAYQKEYKSVMPPYENIDVKDLGKIADYLLTLR